MKKKDGRETKLILVEIDKEVSKKLETLAKEKDWSLRKTIKHAVIAYVDMNGAQAKG